MRHFSRGQTAIAVLISFALLVFYSWHQWISPGQRAVVAEPGLLPVVVQISGQVRAPGIYSFEPPVSGNDVVSAAEGLRSGLRADPGWRTIRIQRGTHVRVLGEEGEQARFCLRKMPISSLLVLGVTADVNSLSVAELSQVPGISRHLAERIVRERQRRGGFKSLEELGRIKGIGPARLKKCRKYLAVETPPEAGRPGS